MSWLFAWVGSLDRVISRSACGNVGNPAGGLNLDRVRRVVQVLVGNPRALRDSPDGWRVVHKDVISIGEPLRLRRPRWAAAEAFAESPAEAFAESRGGCCCCSSFRRPPLRAPETARDVPGSHARHLGSVLYAMDRWRIAATRTVCSASASW